MIGTLFVTLTSSLMMYFMYMDINMVGNLIPLYGVVQIVYLFLLKIFNKYSSLKMKNIFGVFYEISILMGGMMAIICYTYHLLNHNVIPGLNYFYYVYIFIISILITPMLTNEFDVRNKRKGVNKCGKDL